MAHTLRSGSAAMSGTLMIPFWFLSLLTPKRRGRNNDFVTIKVCTQNTHRSARNHRELQFYKHASRLASQHKGQAFIRGLLDTFEVTGPIGQHLCLVHPPMHMTIRELQYMNPSHRLNEQLLRWTLSNLLNALSFLHDEANVVHTGQIRPGIACILPSLPDS